MKKSLCRECKSTSCDIISVRHSRSGAVVVISCVVFGVIPKGLPGHHTETTHSERAAISANAPISPDRSIPINTRCISTEY